MALNAHDFKDVSFEKGPEFLPQKPGTTIATLISLTEFKGYKGAAFHALVRVDETTQPGVSVDNCHNLRWTPENANPKRRTIEFEKLGLFICAAMNIQDKKIEPAKMIEMINTLCGKGDVSAMKIQVKIIAHESNKVGADGRAFVNFRFEAVSDSLGDS